MWKLSCLLLTSLVLTGCQALDPSASDTQPAATQTERTPVPEGINDNFLSAEVDPSEWKTRWEAESREVCANRDAIVDSIGIAAGSTVLDVGAGTGLYVAPFSRAVGTDGRVIPLDIAPGFVEHLSERCQAEGFTNVRPALSNERSVEQPTASVDTAFVCDTYHHFEYHEDMLRSLHAALRPGAQLIIIDFERIPGVSSEWIMGHVRAGKELVTAEIEAAGFHFEEEVSLPGLSENYFLRFRRP